MFFYYYSYSYLKYASYKRQSYDFNTSPERCTVLHWSILDVILSERSSLHTWSVHLTSLEPEEKYKSVHLLLILSAFTCCGCKITNQLTNSWSPMQNTEKKTADWQQKRELIRNFQHNIALHEKETVSSALGDKVAPLRIYDCLYLRHCNNHGRFYIWFVFLFLFEQWSLYISFPYLAPLILTSGMWLRQTWLSGFPHLNISVFTWRRNCWKHLTNPKYKQYYQHILIDLIWWLYHYSKALKLISVRRENSKEWSCF